MSSSSDRRYDSRQVTTIEMPVMIEYAETAQSFPCRVVEVSAQGLRIITNEDIAPGTKLDLVTLGHRYQLLVAWCNEGEESPFVCGLTLEDASQNLQRLFDPFLLSHVS